MLDLSGLVARLLSNEDVSLFDRVVPLDGHLGSVQSQNIFACRNICFPVCFTLLLDVQNLFSILPNITHF